MIASLAKAVGQLTDPKFRRVLLLGLAGTLFLYVILYLGVGWGLGQLQLLGINWADKLIDLLGGIAVVAVTLIMFPAIATLVLSVLLDDVAAAVEAKYYPDLPPPRRQGLGEVVWGALRFVGVTVLANMIALPIYVLLLIVGIGVGLYYLLNGYLLAREYFEMVAWRRMDLAEADTLRRAHLGRLWLMGVAITFLSTIPVVNLLAPLIGTAAMVHEVEALRRRNPA